MTCPPSLTITSTVQNTNHIHTFNISVSDLLGKIKKPMPVDCNNLPKLDAFLDILAQPAGWKMADGAFTGQFANGTLFPFGWASEQMVAPEDDAVGIKSGGKYRYKYKYKCKSTVGLELDQYKCKSKV